MSISNGFLSFLCLITRSTQKNLLGYQHQRIWFKSNKIVIQLYTTDFEDTCTSAQMVERPTKYINHRGSKSISLLSMTAVLWRNKAAGWLVSTCRTIQSIKSLNLSLYIIVMWRHNGQIWSFHTVVLFLTEHVGSYINHCIYDRWVIDIMYQIAFPHWPAYLLPLPMKTVHYVRISVCVS